MAGLLKRAAKQDSSRCRCDVFRVLRLKGLTFCFYPQIGVSVLRTPFVVTNYRQPRVQRDGARRALTKVSL